MPCESTEITNTNQYENKFIFLAKNQLAWVNVCEGSGGRKENSKVRQDYALRGYPTTLLIDCQNGEVIARGELEEIDAMLAELLQ